MKLAMMIRNAWVVMPMLFLGCGQSSDDDQRLTQEIVGTWISDDSGSDYRLYSENNFHRDGMHSADQILHNREGTTTWSFTGTWDVHHHWLIASGQVLRSDSLKAEPYEVEEHIERLDSNELVLVGSHGNRIVKHRKKLSDGF